MPMFTAWSAIRSRYRFTRMYLAPVSIFRDPSVIRRTSSLKFSSCIRSTTSSTWMMFRTDSASCLTNASIAVSTIWIVRSAISRIRASSGSAPREEGLNWRVSSPKSFAYRPIRSKSVVIFRDVLVVREDLPCDFAVQTGQRVDGLADREFAELRERHHILVQLLEPLLQRFSFCGLRHYPNLPVM